MISNKMRLVLSIIVILIFLSNFLKSSHNIFNSVSIGLLVVALLSVISSLVKSIKKR